MSEPEPDQPQEPSPAGVPEVLDDLRAALERFGADVRAPLAELASGLATMADGAARSLQEWSRRLEPPEDRDTP